MRASRRWRAILLGVLVVCSLIAAACERSAATVPLARPTYSPVATAIPDPANATAYQAILTRYTVDQLLSKMSLDEKLGQMFLIETTWQSYTSDVDAMVTGMHAGAMIVYQQNITSREQLRGYIATIQRNARIPLLVSMDEEGGEVDRLGALKLEPPLPSAQDLAATGDPKQAKAAGATAAREMLWYGMNTDLAPVVDVRTTPYAVEYTRLFGNDPKTVARYAGAFLEGLQENGVVGTLKHWPGLGSVAQDPHKTLPTLDASKAELEQVEFAPFKELLPMRPGIVMVTHLMVPAIDPDLPATLSPKLVNGVLRGELGYQGVVMTDSLYMQGISLRWSLPQAAVLAVEAGVDLLEGAYDASSMRGMVDALTGAVQSGAISQRRIDDSVRRILALKVRFGLIPLMRPAHPGQLAVTAQAVPAPDADLPRPAA